MKTFLSHFALCLLLVANSCSTDRIKKRINDTGDVAGQAIGELSTGISNGVAKAIEPTIAVSESLKGKGITFGKMIITSDSGAVDNVLTAYLIFEKDYDGVLVTKAFDEQQREMGRVKLTVSGKQDETRYIEFHFDRRTNIDNNSNITIE